MALDYLIEEAKELNDEQIEMMIEYARFLKYKAANHDVMQKKEEAENWLFNELENGRLSGEENGWIPLSDAVERHLGDMA